MMIALGYIMAILIGLTLGLFGAGGAIISFPVLVYFMNISPVQASVYSLLIVGVTSMIGTVRNFQNSNIDIKTSLIFSIPLLIGFYITKTIVLPMLPVEIIHASNYIFTKDNLIMTIFIITLSYIIVNMIKKSNIDNQNENVSQKTNLFSYIAPSLLVGILAALIGAGGGFIIVPALINIFKLPVKKATGTSLFIITINAFIGTIININNFSPEHTKLILLFIALSITGLFIGSYINKIISSQNLKKSYAYFLIIVLISTIFSEIYKNHQLIK